MDVKFIMRFWEKA